jgi:serine/threonine-protein kinase
MLTGCLPFTAKTPREMFSQLLSQPPVPLNEARAGLRFAPTVELVVMKGLSKDPRQRYDSTCAFAEALRDALASTVAPVAPGLLDRVKSIFKR